MRFPFAFLISIPQMIPHMAAMRGRTAFWVSQVLVALTMAGLGVAWLLAVYAFWTVFGLGGLWLWLVPTSAIVFALATLPFGSGGG